MLTRLKNAGPSELAALVALGAALTLAGAWIFQFFGYLPCELCLKQRYAYYAGVPLALITLIFLRRPGWAGLAGLAFFVLGLMFAANSVFGIYHSGVEWGFWPGPSECTGAAHSAGKVGDFLKQLETVKVVRCDAVAIRILGLSLAGWNALISAGLSLLALRGLFGMAKRA